MSKDKTKKTLKIMITGEGGQGVQTIAKILADTANNQGLHVTYMPHYGVEMRMGISRAFVIISEQEITYPTFSTADIVSVMTKRSLDLVKDFVGKQTTVINAIDLVTLPRDRELPPKTFNMLVLGILIKEIDKVIEIDKGKLSNVINGYLQKKPDLTKNRVAVEVGYDLEDRFYKKDLSSVRKDKFDPVIDKDKQKEHIKYPDVCKGCGLCLLKCPVNALSWDNQHDNFISKPIPKVDMDKCIACGLCERICPDAAIKVNKKKK